VINISQLWTYPFKSGKGQALTSARVEGEGIFDDRRLVALDKDGVFITARKHSELLQLSCVQNESGWLLQHPAQSETCQIVIDKLTTNIAGSLWKDSLQALDAGDKASAWLSEVLEMKVRVAVWKKQSRFSNKYQLETSFSDASPILVTSEASVKQACDWGGIEADTRRFRPNIVVDGVGAFAEDAWKQIRIGGVSFDVLDSCVRCILTTVQPDTGQRHPQREPMVSLMKHHANEAGQPLFGINVKPTNTQNEKPISLGDEVEIIV